VLVRDRTPARPDHQPRILASALPPVLRLAADAAFVSGVSHARTAQQLITGFESGCSPNLASTAELTRRGPRFQVYRFLVWYERLWTFQGRSDCTDELLLGLCADVGTFG
jgi:hypothetical protein